MSNSVFTKQLLQLHLGNGIIAELWGGDLEEDTFHYFVFYFFKNRNVQSISSIFLIFV